MHDGQKPLRRDGAVDCWAPRCVDGPDTLVRAATGATKLSGGRYFCTLTMEAGVSCWDGNIAICTEHSPRVQVVLGSTSATRHEVSETRACALLLGALTMKPGVSCWDGSMAIRKELSPLAQVVVAGITSATDVEVGETLACALLRGGETACWSLLPDDADFAVAAVKAGLPRATALAVGAAHACVRDRSGDPWCWGVPPSLRAILMGPRRTWPR